MKKLTLILSFAFIGIQTFAQEVYQSKAMNVRFFSSTPMEDIEAKTANATSIITTAKNDILFMIQVKSFTFKSSLMQEHFNENYLESSKFANSTFKGKIAGFDAKKLTATKTVYDVEGDLTIHGVTKKVKTKIYLTSNGSKVGATGNFSVHAQDYGIEIPSLVKEKFAEQIKVSFDFDLDTK